MSDDFDFEAFDEVHASHGHEGRAADPDVEMCARKLEFSSQVGPSGEELESRERTATVSPAVDVEPRVPRDPSPIVEQRSYHVMKQPPMGDFITMTEPDGIQEQLYMRLFSDIDTANASQKYSKRLRQANRDLQLLDVAIEDVLADVHKAEASRAMHITASAIDPAALMPTELWVDKYAPASFMDLLSDSKTNRSMLQWMKGWEQNDRKQMESHPPIALLVGPPGNGKSTMAHVLAEHCGYKPVEINASDERSAKRILHHLENATETAATFMSQKPCCVILDEVDGSTGGDERSAVNQVVSYVKKNRKLKKKGRPIVCIANDFYAKNIAALRRERDLVSVFRIDSPRVDTLSSRLLYICRQEHLKTDIGAMSALAEETNCDVRSCLNTLQFISAEGENGALRKSDLAAMPAFHKDESLGIFDVWEAIFRRNMKPNKKQLQFMKRIGRRRFDPIKYIEIALQDFSSKEMIQVLNGIAENYLTMGFADPTLAKISEAADLQSMIDLDLQSNSSLVHRTTSMVSELHFLCCSNNNKKLTFPSQDFKKHLAMQERHRLIESFAAGSSFCRSAALSISPIATLVIPYCLDIINPPASMLKAAMIAKASDKQGPSSDSKRFVTNLVNTMASLGLTYTKAASPLAQESKQESEATAGRLTYHLVPEIDIINTFEGVPMRSTLPDTAKQFIHRESLHHDAFVQHARFVNERQASQSHSHMEQQESLSSSSSVPYRPPATLALPKKVDLKRKPSGVSLAALCGKKIQKTKTKGDRSSLLFRFNEGFSNAVRRDVRISDFLAQHE